MATFQIDIPDEFVKLIKAEGYDVKSWIATTAIQPLAQKYVSSRNAKVLENHQEKIASDTSALIASVKISKKTDLSDPETPVETTTEETVQKTTEEVVQ